MDFTLKLVHMMGLLNLIHYTLKKIRIGMEFCRTIKNFKNVKSIGQKIIFIIKLVFHLITKKNL